MKQHYFVNKYLLLIFVKASFQPTFQHLNFALLVVACRVILTSES